MPHKLSTIVVLLATWFTHLSSAERVRSVERVDVLDNDSPWRYLVVFREPVVGTARSVDPDARPPASWRLRGGDFQSPLPPADWHQVDFDDTPWARGNALLYGGYGDNRPAGTALICLRGRFGVPGPKAARGLSLALRYRGGAVVYINGREVARGHMDDGKAEPLALAEDYPRSAFVTPQGEALLPNYGRAQPPADIRDRFESRIRSLTTDIPTDAIRSGTNVLAVEVHRSAIPDDLPPFGRGVWDTAGLVDIRLTAPGGSAVAEMSPPRGLQVQLADPWARIDASSHAADAAPSVETLQLVAPKNGFCAGQVVVASQEPTDNLTATASDLKSDAGSISARAVQVRFVRLGEPFPPLLNDPTEGATVHPIWLTVHVPADATPGQYTGRLSIEALGQRADVPLHLTVPAWRVDDPSRWKTVVNLLQSPESVAGHYGVPLWSDRHFELIESSFRLMALCGNDLLGISAVGKSVFGDDPIIVFRRREGKFVPEFKFLDRYLKLYDQVAGRPQFLALNVWSYGMYKSGVTRDGGSVEWRNTVIPVVELRSRRLVPDEMPIYGSKGTEELWRQVMDGLAERVERLGWPRECILLGTSGDAWPSAITVDMFKRIAPYARWRVLTHGGGAPKWGATDHERTQPNGMVVGFLEIARRLENRRVKLAGHPVPCNARDKVGSNPYTYLTLPTVNTIIANYDGYCWKGIDYWDYTTPDGTSRNALNTYVHFGNMVGGTPRAMCAAGPNGAVTTVQFELLREGTQQCEAILAIRENLKTIYPQAVRRYDTIDLTLEGALKQHRPGKDPRPAALELKILYDGDQLVTQARPSAPTYNTGKRIGTVRALDGEKRLKYEAEITITDDRWVPGGQGSWVIDLQPEGERLFGAFEGQWKGERRKGTVTGVFTQGGYEEPIGDPPPVTDLSRRCDEAIERVTRIYGAKPPAGATVRKAIARLYALAGETSELASEAGARR